MKKEILYFTDTPSPYKVDFLNQLGNLYDFLVVFQKSKKKHRNSSWYSYNNDKFKAIYLDNGFYTLLNVLFLKPRDYELFITTNYLSLISIILMLKFRLNHKKILLHADGGVIKKRSFIRTKIISCIMKFATDYASSGYFTNLYFNSFGIFNNISIYHFSSLTIKEIENNGKMIKRKCKNENNIFNVLFVGQIIYRKGIDILLDAVKMLPKNISIKIIGGKCSTEFYDLFLEVEKEHDIEFIDYCNKDGLQEYYSQADIFVLPTREDIWGLVINEAMSFGLPIISTDKCIAALEMKKNFDNCIIIPADDSISLYDAIMYLYNNKEVRNNLSKKSLNGINRYTIEQMVYDYKLIIDKIL